MSKNIQWSALLLLSIMLSSCLPFSKLDKEMNSNKYSLEYVSDSQIRYNQGDIAVRLDSIIIPENLLKKETVGKTKVWVVIPLILINFWFFEGEYTPGYAMFNQNVNRVIEKTLYDEMTRAGHFKISDSSEYSLVIQVEKFEVRNCYYRGGMTLLAKFWTGGFSEDVPGEGNSGMKIKYTVLKNGQEVHSNIINSKNTVPDLMNEDFEISKPYLIFANNVAVASSQNLKLSLGKLIEDLNSYFDQLGRK